MSEPGASAREEVLRRIAHALAAPPDGPDEAAMPVPRAYRVADGALDRARRLDRFAARVRDYRGRVQRVAGEEALAAAVAGCLGGAGRYAVPPALPPAWLSAVDPARLVVDDGLEPRALDALEGAVSGCALAVAETGTIVLDGGEAQGPRALTLVPDHLVVVVRERQVVGTVPEAIRALAPAMRAGAPRALTLISGPSATSDIELSRVEGVHGPRRLDVLVVTAA